MINNTKINLEWIPNAYAANNDLNIGEQANATPRKNVAPIVRSNIRMSANNCVIKSKRSY